MYFFSTHVFVNSKQLFAKQVDNNFLVGLLYRLLSAVARKELSCKRDLSHILLLFVTVLNLVKKSVGLEIMLLTDKCKMPDGGVG